MSSIAAAGAPARPPETRIDRRLAGLVVAAGLLALAARTPSWAAVGVVCAVGAAGLLVPLPAVSSRGRATRLIIVAAVGLAAFAVAAKLMPLPPVRLTVAGGLAAVLAGLAEEAFFRRAAYAWLERYGEAAAVAITALAFALVHVPAYGPGVIAVDLAAGLLLGWQRWASGTWTIPAVTHAAANLIQAW